MTELFGPGRHQREIESDSEEGRRNSLVLAFFYVVLTVAIVAILHWLFPDEGWQVKLGVTAGVYYAGFLFRRFLKRD